MLGRPGCWNPVWMNVIAGIVVDRVGVHRLDDGDVVDDLRRVRQQLADPGAGLAVPAELELRSRHQQRRLPHRLRDALPLAHRVGDLRALELRQRRLVVERSRAATGRRTGAER